MLDALFEYTFLQNAFGAAILTGIICGLIGTYVVTNRLVFFSGGITHASFGGIGIAWYLGINPILGATLFSIFSALGMEYLTEKGNFRADTIIGMLWTVGMAIGILFIFITPGYTPNLMSYLFGSILSVETLDLVLLIALTIATVLIFIVFLRPIQFISFDKEFAKTHRLNLEVFQNLMIVLITLTIVLSIKIVGIILIISLLTLPQAIASILSQKYLPMLLLSVLFAIMGTILGLIISWYLNIPSGATIILSLFVIFIVIKITSAIIQKIKTRTHF